MSAFGIDIREDSVCVFDMATTKEYALDRMVEAVYRSGLVADIETLRAAINAREALKSTGIGNGVAFPHVRIDAVRQPALSVGISHGGIDFVAADDKPVRIIVLFAMPADSNKVYLGLLAQVMVALKVPDFSERLTACKSPAEVVAVLKESSG